MVILLLFSCAADPADSSGPTQPGCDSIWYIDADEDGFGDPARGVTGCEAPSGTVADASDCDDTDAAVHPGADERCDGADQDCDGVADDDPADGTTWYTDADADGYGDPLRPARACEAPDAWVGNPDDCDDRDPAVSPDAVEVCDTRDNDCDGTADGEDAEGAVPWWVDADGDGWGRFGAAIQGCFPPPGTSPVTGDCDDTRPDVAPDAFEQCNGVDDNCDGLEDDATAIDAVATFADDDDDGFGESSTLTLTCVSDPDRVSLGGDCDDTDPRVAPGEVEICNGYDDDCDGDVDGAGALGASYWFADADGDGWGNPASSRADCAAPAGYVANTLDCDDGDSTISPSGTERCDGVDDDCDGVVDEAGAFGELTWFEDADGDGVGVVGVTTLACDEPAGWSSRSDDCDDTDDTVSPLRGELCDGRDDDCDGTVDEPDAVDASTWYLDGDGDGYGGPSGSTSCTLPPGYAAPGDCDDADPGVHPGASEADCADPVDYNCDGSTGWSDADGDGWAACEDCDDAAADVSPDSVEICNDLDDDCDGGTDLSAADAAIWYADTDGDGRGDPSAPLLACDEPSGWVADATDCDDGNAAVSPDGMEDCATVADDDCDGSANERNAQGCAWWYLDSDGDGAGSTSAWCLCAESDPFTATSGDDCDDGDGSIGPDAEEVFGNGVDDDCDGYADTTLLDDEPALYSAERVGYLGTRVAVADVSGDGVGDLLAGSPYADEPIGNAGCVYTLFGGELAQVPATDAEVAVCGDSNSDQAGAHFDVGDLDGDGELDLVVGAAGSAWVLPGPLADTTIASASLELDVSGADLSGGFAGDTDGDGLHELIVSASETHRSSGLAYDGALLLVRGDRTGTLVEADADVVIVGSAGEGLSNTSGPAGDTNGDGLADVVAGACGNNYLAGAVYLFEGPLSSGDVSSSVATLTGDAAADRACVAYGVGDLDEDGYDDIAVSSTPENSFYVALGPVRGTWSVSAADLVVALGAWGTPGGITSGDFSVDGDVDLLLAAQQDSTCSGAGGSVWALPGATLGTVAPGDVGVLLACGADGASVGESIALGDLDGDGLPEVVIGGSETGIDGAFGGIAWILPGW